MVGDPIFEAMSYDRSPTVTEMYDYVFSENGLVAFKDGKLLNKMVHRLL